MASKKGGRSSKTDHVLNLLSHPSSPEPQQPATKAPEETVPSNPEMQPAQAAVPAQEHRLTPPVLEVARANNEALEETIREALENALAQEESTDAGAGNTGGEMETPSASPEDNPEIPAEPSAPPEILEAEPAPSTSLPEEESPSPEQQPAPPQEPALSEEKAAEEPVLEEAPVLAAEDVTEQPSAPEEPPWEETEEAAPQPTDDPAPVQETLTAEKAALIKPEEVLPDESRFVNVMLPLVEEKLLKYVRLFHLCECPRCLADVKALALSRLPPKYMVMEGTAYTPMMSYLQAKYDSTVTAQIVYACKQVMESPRHGKIPGQKN